MATFHLWAFSELSALLTESGFSIIELSSSVSFSLVKTFRDLLWCPFLIILFSTCCNKITHLFVLILLLIIFISFNFLLLRCTILDAQHLIENINTDSGFGLSTLKWFKKTTSRQITIWLDYIAHISSFEVDILRTLP